MNETLKKQFDGLCQDFGMNASTAINVFARGESIPVYSNVITKEYRKVLSRKKFGFSGSTIEYLLSAPKMIPNISGVHP